MDLYYASWWGKAPSKCACGKKMKKEEVDERTVYFFCPEHGVRVIGTKKLKRGEVEDWHYYRLVFEKVPDRRVITTTRLSLW